MVGQSKNFTGSLGNTAAHGKGAKNIAMEMRNQQPKNLDISDVDFVGDRFVFSIRGKQFMTVTASSGIKKKIVQKLCKAVPTPENPA